MTQEINIVGMTFKEIFPADERLKTNLNEHAAFQKSGHLSIALTFHDIK